MKLVVLELAFVVTWSSGFIAAEYGLDGAGPFTLLGWRYLGVGLLLAAWLAARGRLRRYSRAEVAPAVVVGLLAHAVWLGAAFQGQAMGVTPGASAMITAVQPLLTAALSGWLIDEPVNRRQWLGLALGFLGVVLVVADEASLSDRWAAHLLPLVSALGLTAAVLYQRRRERSADGAPALPADVALLVQVAATAVVLLPPAVAVEGLRTSWSAGFVLTLAWLGLVTTLASYGLLWALLRRATAGRVSGLFYLTPPATMLMGWVLFAERPSLGDAIGLVVAGAGVALVRLASRQARPVPSADPVACR